MSIIVTFPLYKKVRFMDHLIEVPMWVRYLAIKPRVSGNKADIIGFTHKPYITARHANWRLPSTSNGTKEILGYITECNIKFNDSARIFSTLIKLPEE